VFYVYDAFGWVAATLVISLLFLGLIALVAWVMDDIPFELLGCFRGIFRWTREPYRHGERRIAG